MIELWIALALYIGNGGLVYIGATTGTALMISTSPYCSLPVGTSDWECTEGAKITEVIRITRPGEPDLVCELLEVKGTTGGIEFGRAGEWAVYENRMFCRREPKGAK